MRLIYVFFAISFLFISCKERIIINNSISEPDFEVNIEENDEIPDPYRVLAAEIASKMDEKHLASQIIISGIDGNGMLPTHMARLLTLAPAGGIMLFRGNLNSDNSTIRGFLSDVSLFIEAQTGIKPFIAVDHEGGSVNRFSSGVATLPAASSYWQLYLDKGWAFSIEKIREDSLKAGREISGMGINMNLAPIAEYLIKENSSFLQWRSYGPNPFFTSEAAKTFVSSMDKSGVICVIKHFPASAGDDPHYFPSVIDMDKNSLGYLVSPFADLIKYGARAVMIAHTYVPQIDSVIASLSPLVMQNWLRDELGFDGIIISDDFNMAAAGNLSPEQAAINSVIAGADMILVWQHELSKTYNAIIAALQEGRLPRERLLDAVQRIIYEKLRMGLIKVP